LIFSLINNNAKRETNRGFILTRIAVTEAFPKKMDNCKSSILTQTFRNPKMAMLSMLLILIFLLLTRFCLMANGSRRTPPIRNLQAVMAKGDIDAPIFFPTNSRVEKIHIVIRQKR